MELLSCRTRSNLLSENLKTKNHVFRFVALHGRKGLKKIPNIGAKSYKEISAWLDENKFEAHWSNIPGRSEAWFRRVKHVQAKRAKAYFEALQLKVLPPGNLGVKVHFATKFVLPGNIGFRPGDSIYIHKNLIPLILETKAGDVIFSDTLFVPAPSKSGEIIHS